MKKKAFTLLLLLSVIHTLCYAQNGNYSENRSVGSFNGIDACCGVDVYISEGNSSTVKVETNYEEYLSLIKTKVKKGELKISFNIKDMATKKPNNMWIKVYITASNLTTIHASSGSDIMGSTPLLAKDIKISASSGSDIKLELTTTTLECSSSSGSDIKISGKASYASLKASTGSDINLRGMTIGTVDASASAGSDIVVNVVDAINAKASGGADVTFRGNPTSIKKRKMFGGDVNHIK